MVNMKQDSEPSGQFRSEPDFMGHRERLKERFVRHGVGGMPDVQVLELLLSYAIPRKDVRPTAEELLRRFGGLKQVLDASSTEIESVTGISVHTSVLIRVVRELITLHSEKTVPMGDFLKSPVEVEKYLLSRLRGTKNESILLIFLDDHGAVLGEEQMGTGTIDEVVLFPRAVMAAALHHNASALILVHNHPHGPPIPSLGDREQSQRLKEVLRPFDITLRDSIVVGRNRCFSIFSNQPL